MNLSKTLIGAALVWSLGVGVTFAADSAIPEGMRAVLEKMFPGMKPDRVTESAIPGLFEAVYGPDVIYVSRDGHYVLEGDLFDTKTRTNLTEQRRAAGRLALLDKVDPASMIIFAPKEVKHTITVFTDVDCPYCRKLHQHMADYNGRGIAIRYMAYPRTGVNTPSYYKAVSVWCAKDRRAALTEAKQGEVPPRRSCDNPVQAQMALADRLGITGTPTIVLEDGTMFSGYVPPEQLSAYLDSHLGQAGQPAH